jgi:hypothetical protein
MRKKEYRSFESARKFAQKLGLKNREQWQAYCKSGNNPDDIPASAGSIYKKDFKDWPDFLGYNRIAKYTESNTRPFEDARKFVRSLKLKGTSAWQEYCKSGNKPKDIPGNPGLAYPKEFKKNGKWGDWLGTGTISSQDKQNQMKSFKDARKFVRTLKLKDNTEWKEYCKSGKRPSNIPAAPNDVYKNKGWDGIPDWLGNGNSSNTRRDYFSYEQCSKLIQKNNISTQDQLTDFRKSYKNPEKIPGHPWDVYKTQGTWVSWPDFTGTGKVANQNREFKSFKDAKIFAISLNLKGISAWREYCKSGDKPDDIHSVPQNIYKKEWTTWGDFLGNGAIANQNKEYLSAKEAKPVYQKLFKDHGIKNGRSWAQFAKTNKKLLEELHLPADVLVFYSKEKYEKSLKK